MRVTGNSQEKPADQENIVKSIQLSLNGLSFSIYSIGGGRNDVCGKGSFEFRQGNDLAANFSEALEVHEELRDAYSGVMVVMDTHNVNLVPDTVFSEDYLNDPAGRRLRTERTNETVAVSPAVNNIIAEITLPKPLFDLAKAQYGESLSFFHPLQVCIAGNRKSALCLFLGDGVLHVVLTGDELQFADSFKYGSDADILFFIEEIDRIYSLKWHILYVDGKNAVQVSKLLKKYCKRVEAGDTSLNMAALLPYI